MGRARVGVVLTMAWSLLAGACTAPETPRTVPSGEPPTSATTASPEGANAPPPFHASVSPVTAADLPGSWRPGCPLPPDRLRMLHLTYWGFDDRPATGAIVVSAAQAEAVVAVFRRLYEDRFPIRRMEPVDAYGGDDRASMAADNTSGFNCRPAVASGPARWSAHAFGEAIDINPVENPYLRGGEVLPPAGEAYLDRSRHRPGMVVEGGVVTAAFASVGWSWGGEWAGTPDYQHFSVSGR